MLARGYELNDTDANHAETNWKLDATHKNRKRYSLVGIEVGPDKCRVQFSKTSEHFGKFEWRRGVVERDLNVELDLIEAVEPGVYRVMQDEGDKRRPGSGRVTRHGGNEFSLAQTLASITRSFKSHNRGAKRFGNVERMGLLRMQRCTCSAAVWAETMNGRTSDLAILVSTNPSRTLVTDTPRPRHTNASPSRYVVSAALDAA